MHGLHGRVVARQPAADLHQAARVAGDDGADARALDGVDLVVEDGDGNLRVLDGERPAEAAARVGVRQLDELGAADVTHQAARLLADIQVAQAVAGVVPGDAPFEGRAHVFDLEHVHQKGAELVRARGERLGAASPRLVVGEQLVEVVRHRRARPRGADDVVGPAVPEDLYETAREAARLRAVAGVEGRLSAARLPLVEDDLAARAPQDFDRARPDRGPELVDQTRDEERDSHPFPSAHASIDAKARFKSSITSSDIGATSPMRRLLTRASEVDSSTSSRSNASSTSAPSTSTPSFSSSAMGARRETCRASSTGSRNCTP